MNGERSPKRRRLNSESNGDTPLGAVSAAPTPRRPSWSPPTGIPTPANVDDEESPDELDHTVIRHARPLPRRRGSGVPATTPGYDATSAREGSQDPVTQSPQSSPSTPRERSNTPNGDRGSSPVPSHSTVPDLEADHVEDVQLRYKPRLILRGHKRAVAAVRFSPDGKYIASCSADATARIWSASTGQPMHILSGHLAGISCLAWSPDSLTLATGSDDKSIRLWSATTGQPHPTPLLGHHNYIYSLAFSPGGNMLVSGSYDEAVYLWDVRSARVMRSLPAHSDPVGGVDFVRDGTLLVSCSSDGLIRVWDTGSGQCLRTFFHEDTPPVVSVKFSPNGKYIATWMLDNSIRMWNYIEGRCVKTYQGHVNGKYSLQGGFGTYNGSEDGEENKALIASGSEDGSIFLWDVNSKKVLQRLDGHLGPVMGVDVNSKDKSIVSCGLDKTIRIWRSQDNHLVNGANGTAH